MTYAELKERMSVSEFYEWMVLEQLEPFGEQGHYLRMGILAAVVTNGFRAFAGVKDGKHAKPEDFIPKIEAPKTEAKDIQTQTAEQMHAFMMALTRNA